VPLEGKFLLIALVIVRITLNVSVSNVPKCLLNNGVSIVQNLLSNSQTLPQCYSHLLRKRCRSVWVLTNAISKNLPSSGLNGFQLWCTFTPWYMWSKLTKKEIPHRQSSLIISQKS